MNKTSEQLNELFAALAKAQGEIKGAVKDANNPFFKSHYTSLDGCWDACRVPLSSNGLAIVQTAEENDGKLFLHTILAHSSGQYLSSTMPLLLTKQDPQSLGSALTYMRRYSLCAIVGLTQADDDGEAAMKGHRAGDMTIFDFSGIISRECKTAIDVADLETFLNTLATGKSTSINKIMEQASKSDQIKQFIAAFKEWEQN